MAAALDASTLRAALDLFCETLRDHRDELDSLNVYPVPDGDTGTNLLATQEAVREAVAALPPDVDSGALGAAVARASLLAARGNSGVILSQVLRALFEALPPGPAGARDVARALEAAATAAYRAVARPQEGTVLTVLREAGEAAARAAERGADVGAVLESALATARASLARTRDLHPVLREAGVVDAGGKGVVLLLDALRAAVRGDALSEPVGPGGPVSRAETPWAPPPEALARPFEVQYLVEAEEQAVADLRRRLEEVGDSLVVVGGDGLFHVHVHTDRPGAAVELARAVAEPRDVSVVDLRERVDRCLAGQLRAVRVAEEQRCAAVAVAEGEGLRRVFASLGAMVVPGGPGNNPSVADLLAAVEAAPAEAVVLLPNHPNVLPAARAAALESRKEVLVVESRSVPAGLSAAAAFNPFLSGNANARAMAEAASRVRAGEVARAERDARTPAGPVRRGEWMGMVEGEPVSVGPSVVDVAMDVVRGLADREAEVVTVVVGSGLAPEERRAVEEALRGLGWLEVEVVEGGQPRYALLVGVE
jgi:DAK2 domain fusion protein YloV